MCARTSFNTRLFDILSWENHEAHFSAVRRTPQAYARVSGPHAHERRKGGDSGAASKRARSAWRLSHAERYRKAQRLRGEAIAQILAATRPRRAGSVSVHLKSNGLQYSRLGLVVPKRFLPRAVDRNHAKRLLREWFRRKQTIFTGQDLLVRLGTRRSQLESLVADLERAVGFDR